MRPEQAPSPGRPATRPPGWPTASGRIRLGTRRMLHGGAIADAMLHLGVRLVIADEPFRHDPFDRLGHPFRQEGDGQFLTHLHHGLTMFRSKFPGWRHTGTALATPLAPKTGRQASFAGPILK